jgi:hypothetical protein
MKIPALHYVPIGEFKARSRELAGRRRSGSESALDVDFTRKLTHETEKRSHSMAQPKKNAPKPPTKKEGNLDKIGALWLGVSQAGVKYMSGMIGDQRVVVFKNGYKEEAKHPDYIVYLSKPLGAAKEDEKAESTDAASDDIPF